MFGRQIRTRLDLLKRNFAVEKNEGTAEHDAKREFVAGEKVQVLTYPDPCVKWVFGIVFAQLGLAQYEKETKKPSRARKKPFINRNF
jgi:hypothetical protein